LTLCTASRDHTLALAQQSSVSPRMPWSDWFILAQRRCRRFMRNA
jgi:hypothetical protein